MDGHHFPDGIFKYIFVNENVWIAFKISLEFVYRCPSNNIPALFQIMTWGLPDDNPLSEPVPASLGTHIRVTQAQWVKT